MGAATCGAIEPLGVPLHTDEPLLGGDVLDRFDHAVGCPPHDLEGAAEILDRLVVDRVGQQLVAAVDLGDPRAALELDAFVLFSSIAGQKGDTPLGVAANVCSCSAVSP